MKKILFAVLSLMIFSCGEKFLDVDPETIQLSDDALGTYQGLEGAILSVYDFPRKQFRSMTGCLYFIAGTHLVKSVGLRSQDMNLALYKDLNSEHAPSKEYWNNSYKALNEANAIINRAPNLEFPSEQRRNNLIAQARFFRAYILFYLYQRFEYIPLYTEEILVPRNDFTVAAKDDVFKVITEDLVFSAANIDTTVSTKIGKITKGATCHLLAKVYLYLQKYPEAAENAIVVINSNKYQLLADRSKLWADGNQNNDEAIYVLQLLNNALDGGYPFVIAPMFVPRTDQITGMVRSWETGGRPWARHYASDYLIRLFEPTDKRLEADYKTVWTYNNTAALPRKIKPKWPLNADSITIKLGDTVKTDHWWNPDSINIDFYGPACKKYWEYGSTRSSLQIAETFKPIIRYRLGETYLIAAEALMRQSKNDSALIMINKVRERAGATLFTVADMTETKLLEEYARECAFENEDWFTFKRVGKLVEYVKHLGPDSTQSEITEEKLRMPVPLQFRDATPSFVLPK